jgi:hypothetical protein
MRFLVASALILVCALVLLWRELGTPVESPTSHTTGRERASTAPSMPGEARSGIPHEPPEIPDEDALPLATAASPLGGMRAWSPSAVPTGGPDPFAPVVEIRTEDDTRAGLPDEATR